MAPQALDHDGVVVRHQHSDGVLRHFRPHVVFAARDPTGRRTSIRLPASSLGMAFTGAMLLLEAEQIVEVTQSPDGIQTLVRSARDVCLDEWTHVALVHEAGTVILYVNGQEVSRDGVTGTAVRLRVGPLLHRREPRQLKPWYRDRMEDSRFCGESLTEAHIRPLVRRGFCHRPTT